MTDKELLELAAKAAGYDVHFTDEGGFSLDIDGYWPHGFDKYGDVIEWWNPLTDDGDALRLAVKLGVSDSGGLVLFFADADDNSVVMQKFGDCSDVLEVVESDPCAATRRAIVRAAAKIGRTK